MPLVEEELLPENLRHRAVKSGNEWGWRLDDVPLVAKACEKLGFAILRGQAQFYLPDGTCEMYWLKADPAEKKPNESWKEYSKRSCSEFLQFFEALVERTDFEKEGTESFRFLKEKKAAGVNIKNYLCFIIYPISEINYSQLLSSKQVFRELQL